jgi:hypothetical protein
MKNLKKVLSLVLALAMAFSLMSVALAVDKASDFTDYDDVDYQTAVDVMTAIGVFNGYDDGTSFNPTGTLTREQGAKIITYMLLGSTAADKLETTAAPFTDVPASKWSAGAIAYCAERGILAGTGDGTFKPEGTLTGYAFAKMLLIALGYDADIQNYVGSSWAINVAADAVSAGIDISGVALSETVTREQAAQMSFQTLTATMVTYSSKGTNITLSDGTSVNIGASAPAAVSYGTNYTTTLGGTNDYTQYDTQDNKEGTQQFVEKYYSTLKLSGATTNSLGVPGNSWTLDNKSVSFAARTPVAVFTGKQSAAEIASALSGYYITDDAGTTHSISNAGATTYTATLNTYTTGNDATFNVVPSTHATPASQIAAGTANGKRVEVYADSNGVITNFNVIQYYVGEVTNVVVGTDRTTYTIKALDDGSSFSRIDYVSESETDTISVKGTIAKGDIVTYTVAKTVSSDPTTAAPGSASTAGTFVYVYPTTTVVGSQTIQNTGDNTITVGGTVYPVGVAVYTKNDQSAAVATSGFSVSSSEATYYLDKDGYVVYSTAAASTDYAMIVSAYASKSVGLDGYTPSVTVRAVLSDGTVVTRTISLEKVSASKAASSNGALTAGDYVLKDTNYKVAEYNVSSVAGDTTLTAFETLLKTGVTVWNYSSLTDSSIALTSLNTVSAANAQSETYKATLSSIAKNTSLYIANSTNVLFDANTVFVVYNQNKTTAAVYTGAGSLPASVDASGTYPYSGYAVLKTSASNGQYGTASVVFLTTTNGLTADSSNYAYVVTSDVTTSLASDGGTVYNYKAYKAGDDATSPSLTLTSTTKLGTSAANNGLYSYTDDNVIGGLQSSASDTNFADDTDLYIYGSLTVIGTQLVVHDDTTNTNMAFTINSDSLTTYLNGLTEIDRNYGFVAINADGSVRGTTVSGIFVTNS